MERSLNLVRGAFACLGAVVGVALGGSDDYLVCLVVFVVVDYLSGVALAISERKLSSKVGYRGITRKVMIFVLVGLTSLIDTRILREGFATRTAVIFFYLANEGISIVENCAALGLPVPQKLKDVLASLQNLK